MKSLQPSQARPRASEHQLQASLCEYLRVAQPELLHFAVGNGGRRPIGVAKKLKAEGVMPGVSDLIFVLPEGRTAFLEMKVKGGRLSDEQKVFRDAVTARGHVWGIAKTFDEAMLFLRLIGALK